MTTSGRDVSTAERDRLLAAVAKSIRARDFDLTTVLLHRLAVVDPISADQILTLINTLAPPRQS